MDFNQSSTGHLRPSDLGGSHLFQEAGEYTTYSSWIGCYHNLIALLYFISFYFDLFDINVLLIYVFSTFVSPVFESFLYYNFDDYNDDDYNDYCNYYYFYYFHYYYFFIMIIIIIIIIIMISITIKFKTTFTFIFLQFFYIQLSHRNCSIRRKSWKTTRFEKFNRTFK